jgi:GGDEF domain-containing protein
MKTFHDTMSECLRVIKNTLRRQGDEVVGNNGDILVMLIDCAKENSMLVQERLEQALNKFLEEKKIRDKIDIKYGYATFPDDGNTDAELINKARLSIYPGL